MSRRKLVRKKDWDRLDRVLNYRTIAGAGLGYFYGLIFSATLVPVLGKVLTAVIGIPITFLVVLLWDYVEQAMDSAEEATSG